jgi:hypothetical protein
MITPNSGSIRIARQPRRTENWDLGSRTSLVSFSITSDALGSVSVSFLARLGFVRTTRMRYARCLVPTPQTQKYSEAPPHKQAKRETAKQSTGQLQKIPGGSDIGVSPFGEPEQQKGSLAGHHAKHPAPLRDESLCLPSPCRIRAGMESAGPITKKARSRIAPVSHK